jgi:hypothetical protein
LARIVPCREPLHGFSTHTHTHRGKVHEQYIPEGEGKTHDHEIKRKKDPTLGPVRFGVSRNVVDEEARADEEDDFEEI